MTDNTTPKEVTQAAMTEAGDLLPETDLKLCPWGHPADVEHLENGRWSVGCRNEDCLGFMSWTTFARKAEAITAWHTRAPITPSVDKLVEALTRLGISHNSFIEQIGPTKTAYGNYRWVNFPTHEQVQEALEAANFARTTLSQYAGEE